MLQKIRKNRQGEGYIDVCVGVVVFVMLLVVAINLFSFITLRIEMDEIADELIETATYSGSFSDELWSRNSELLQECGDYDVAYGADAYFNSVYHRVQLGHVMWVEISVQTHIEGLGAFKIPVTITVRRSGLSQKYWKQVAS